MSIFKTPNISKWLIIIVNSYYAYCVCVFVLNASMQEDLKTTQSAREREAKQMAQLERTRQRNPSDRQIIVSLACLLNTMSIQKELTATFSLLLHEGYSCMMPCLLLLLIYVEM